MGFISFDKHMQYKNNDFIIKLLLHFHFKTVKHTFGDVFRMPISLFGRLCLSVSV